MAKPRKVRRESPERQEAPHGRETPVIGPREAPKKVRPLKGEPGIARRDETDVQPPNGKDDPWQDPGGPEPANG